MSPPLASANPSQPSPTASGFALSGVSSPPDPSTHAYRKDLADTALAGRVIASHYADPMPKPIRRDAVLRTAPDAASTPLGDLAPGTLFRMLDNSRGWAWGYAPDGRVGYVESGAFLD